MASSAVSILSSITPLILVLAAVSVNVKADTTSSPTITTITSTTTTTTTPAVTTIFPSTTQALKSTLHISEISTDTNLDSKTVSQFYVNGTSPTAVMSSTESSDSEYWSQTASTLTGPVEVDAPVGPVKVELFGANPPSDITEFTTMEYTSEVTTTVATTTIPTTIPPTTENPTTANPTTENPTTEILTTTPPPTPYPPYDVQISAINDIGLEITWVINGTHKVLRCHVALYVNGTNAPTEMIGSQNVTYPGDNTTFGGLLPGQSYVATVQACYDDCSGEATSPQNNTYPASPNISDSDVRNPTLTGIELQWNQTGIANNFSVVANPEEPNEDYDNNYYLNCSSQPPECSINCTYVCELNNLPGAGWAYTIVVTAWSGSLSSESNPIQATTLPPNPRGIQCEGHSNTSLSISISPPNYYSLFFVEYYNITYNSTIPSYISSSCVESLVNVTNNTEPATPEALPYLISGVTYNITAQSVSLGQTNDDVSNMTYCTTALNPPQDVTADGTAGNSISVSWSLPVHPAYYNGFNVICERLTTTDISKEEIYNIDETMFTCSNTMPGAAYSVNVSTFLNGSIVNPAVSNTVQLITVPYPPAEVSITGATTYSISVTITPNTSSECTYYNITTVPLTSVQRTENCNISTPVINGLKPNTNYSVSVTAYSVYEGIFASAQSNPVVSDIGFTVATALTYVETQEVAISSAVVVWQTPEYNNENILSYKLNVASITCGVWFLINCSDPTITSATGECGTLSLTPTNSPSCLAANMSYSLNNLSPATNYSFTVTAINPSGSSVPSGYWFLTGNNSPNNVGTIVGAVLGTLAGVAVLVVVFYFAYWKRRIPKADGAGVNGVTNYGIDMTPIPPDEQSRPLPVRITDFLAHVQNLHKDTDYEFSAEFKLLQEMSPKHPQTAAELQANRVKNRFTNILPFDHSRVKLKLLDDDDDQGTDYINASYMPGFNLQREFIAAQGPMKCTIDDFWRMIWEQNVSIIVVVTNLTEKGKEKCAQYWPSENEAVYYGDVQVILTSESTLNQYVLRVFDVRFNSKTRTIRQLHFQSWPDFGCPDDPIVLIEFASTVRETHQQLERLQNGQSLGPILVHCSAGVGRTGTFILVDHLLQLIRTQGSIDIFGTILDMRNYRVQMIQSEAQYIFAHECMKLAIERGLHRDSDDADVECIYADGIELQEESMYMNTTFGTSQGNLAAGSTNGLALSTPRVDYLS